MGSSNIRDLLTSFSPALDFLAISSGDGRIKIWDTVKGQIQTEFSDITTNDPTSVYSKPERGHLSIDYTCMKWVSIERKKKRKFGGSLLVLGTGGGDVLALDVSAGQMKWRVSDCHPGGISAISVPAYGSSIYTAGADGMICEIDSWTGNLLRKFKASTKAISSMSISPDGKIVATAAAQLKILNLSNQKKIQKFSGHPGAVRCMTFTEDGKYILSSAAEERYIAVWKVDSFKKQSASCLLALEHPAVFLDSKQIDGEGLSVFAISETGVGYYWYGNSLDELHNAKPTKVSLSVEDLSTKNFKGGLPTIFSAKLQGILKPGSGQVFIAHGLLVKPFFQKIMVQYGTDVKLPSSADGVLLPISQSLVESKKGLNLRSGAITALDHTNAEDALLPIPKLFDLNEQNKHHQDWKEIDPNEDNIVDANSATICMEDQLRSLGILNSKDDAAFNSTLDSTIPKGINLEANMQQKKLTKVVLSMAPTDAYKLLETLAAMWESRSISGKYALPWIYSLLLNHGQHIMAQEPTTCMLDSLSKISKARGTFLQQLLLLSGRLQLVTAQIDKAFDNKTRALKDDQQMELSENEDEDEDINDILYGEEEEDDDDESEISDENDNN